MWGEIKFWANRYSRWIWVAIGLVLITAVFILGSLFSTDDDRQMKKQAREDEKVQEVIEEQQEDVLGEEGFADAVNDIPTDKELMIFLDGQDDLNEGDYFSEKALEHIQDEYGELTMLLANEGYILSEDMTAEQRVIVQLNQESEAYLAGLIDPEERQSEVYGADVSVGVPKTLYDVKKHLGQHVLINNYTIGVYDKMEEETPEWEIYGYDSALGYIDMGYVVEEEVDLGDVSLVGGMVIKGRSEDESEALETYLVFRPNVPMSGSEYYEIIQGLEVTFNKDLQPTEEMHGYEEVLNEIKNLYKVQMVDAMYSYIGDSSFSNEGDVTLQINGKDIPLVLMGNNFQVEIGK